MSQDDLTDFDDDNAQEALEPASVPAPRASIGFGRVFSLFVLALGGGAVGGWALGQYVMPKFVPSPYAQTAHDVQPIDMQPILARLSAAEDTLSQHSAGLSRLTAQINAKPATITVGQTGAGSDRANIETAVDLTPILARISALEDRAAAPISGDAPQADSPVLDGEGTPLPDNSYLESVETRIAALETSLSEIGPINTENTRNTGGAETQIDAPQIDPPQIDTSNYDEKISALRLRIDEVERALSAELESAKALAAVPTVVKDPVLLPPFPRQAMLDILSAPEGSAEQGWIGKTLKKHISVRNPQDVARANSALDTIENAAARGDYEGALARIAELPSQARSAARDWTAAVEREVGSPVQPRQTLGEKP